MRSRYDDDEEICEDIETRQVVGSELSQLPHCAASLIAGYPIANMIRRQELCTYCIARRLGS